MKRRLPSTSVRVILSTALTLLLIVGVRSSIRAQAVDESGHLGTRASIANDSNDNEATHIREAAEYFKARATSGDVKDWNEVRRIGYESFRAMGSNVAMKAQSTPAWLQVGGSEEGRTSGRLRGIAFDPTDPKIVYLAAAQGGVWKTSDITANSPVWVSISDQMPTQVMGAIAVDPHNGQILYAGTGEVQGGFSAPGGLGLYKSTDGGLSWNLIASTAKVGFTCGQILVDPSNSQHVFVATGSGAGLQVSNDGGGTFTNAVTKLSDPVSIAMDPTDPNKMYVGAQSGGVSRSTDGGVTWTKWTLTTGGTGSISTTIVAVAPSAPNMIYASVSNGSANSWGIALSTDFGVTWRVMNKCNQEPANQLDDQNPSTATSYPNRDYLHTQGYYGNAITVNPQNPSQIIVGGIDVWSSSDSGKSLVHTGYWTANLENSRYVHADNHGLKYQGNTLYAISDGGIFQSQNGGQSWSSAKNGNLNTFQYVGVDADPRFTYVLGGTQDNGVLRERVDETVSHFSRGGDAGILWIADDGATAYSTYVNADFQKSNDSGKSWTVSNLTGKTNYINNPSLLNEGAMFYAPWDVFIDGTTVAYAGWSHIYVSTNGGEDGFPYKSATSFGAYSVHVSSADPTIAWAGTNNGKIFHCTDLNANSSHWASSTLPGGAMITGITSNPDNPAQVWAVMAGTGNRHFNYSADSGKTWTSSATNFPNLPCNSIARDPSNGNLFVGTDFGVVFSEDSGVTWQKLGANLPLVQVLTLKVKSGGPKPILLAGTYGRGSFYIDITKPSGAVQPSSQPSNTIATLHAIYPNPTMQSGTATIGFNLFKGGVTLITLHDVTGREVQTLAKENMTAGEHSLKLNTTTLAAGTYICALTSAGVTVMQKIVIVR